MHSGRKPRRPTFRGLRLSVSLTLLPHCISAYSKDDIKLLTLLCTSSVLPIIYQLRTILSAQLALCNYYLCYLPPPPTMNSTAFATATPILARASPALSTSTFTARRPTVTVSARRCAVITMKEDEPEIREVTKLSEVIPDDIPPIPQGWTGFAEQLNGRAAMVGFALAIVTEAITGKGVVGQVGALFDISNIASALNIIGK